MSKNALLGLIGGVLVVVAVFVSDGGLNFDDAHKVVMLLAGLVIIAGVLLGKFGVAGIGAIAALTLALIFVYAWLKHGLDFEIFVLLLVVGAVAATVGTVSRKA